MAFWTVPREWEGEDVFIIGGGPSLRGFDASVLKGQRVIAVNNAYLLAPWADVLYFGDGKWFMWNKADLGRHIGKYKITRATIVQHEYDIRILKYKAVPWCPEPDTLGGRDSGHSAINLAVHFGAKRIFLLGFDMQQTGGENNWHKLHKRQVGPERYRDCFLPGYKGMVEPLRKRGVEVYNCCLDSALEVFPKITFDQALDMVEPRTFAVATSMTEKMFNDYGHRMVSTFDKHWPDDIQLMVYCEDFYFGRPSERVLIKDLHWECLENLVKFKKRWGKDPRRCGIGHGKPYQYRMDAVKFSNKAYAVIDATRKIEADVLIWMDADTMTHQDMPKAFLERLIPRDIFISWLERRDFYPECGFYLLNLRHPALKRVMDAWEHLYNSAEIFDLKEWHDSYVLEYVIRDFEREGVIKTHSISGKGAPFNHVLINSPLGKYLDHLKGKYKKLKRSPAGTLKVKRKEKHWKQ